MKLSRLFMIAAASMSLFACSQEGRENPNGERKMTLVTLKLGQSADTRALNETAAGKYNNVNTLAIEFYTANGNRVQVNNMPDLTEAVAALNSAHTATIAIDSVPETATQIVVIANEKDILDKGTIGGLNKSEVTLVNMHDNDAALAFNQQNSVMTGKATIGTADVDGVAHVNVAIKPVSSRVEIGKISAVAVQEEEGQIINDIKSFSLAGIYMTRFYTEGALDPTQNAGGRNKVDLLTDTAKYHPSGYPAELTFMCDDFMAVPVSGIANADASTRFQGRSNSWQVAPEAGKYYGYPVLAGDEVIMEGNVYDVACMVLKLRVVLEYLTTGEGVLVENTENKALTKFITVQGYKKTDGTKVTKFVRNEVYRIENLEFDQFDMTDVPFEGEKTVEAIVTVLPWELVTVIPDIQ